MVKTEQTAKKVLLFGFDDLRTILAVKTALEPFGAELVPVGRGDYGKSLAALAGLEGEGEAASGTEAGLVVGRMAVLCGLREELDALLPALAAAGAGSGCLKAVLTEHNRAWSAGRLYGELDREHRAVSEAAGRP